MKNSAGGAEPDNSSPIAGARRKRTSAGGNSSFFIVWHHSCVSVYVSWLARHHFFCSIALLICDSVCDGLFSTSHKDLGARQFLGVYYECLLGRGLDLGF